MSAEIGVPSIRVVKMMLPSKSLMLEVSARTPVLMFETSRISVLALRLGKTEAETAVTRNNNRASTCMVLFCWSATSEI